MTCHGTLERERERERTKNLSSDPLDTVDTVDTLDMSSTCATVHESFFFLMSERLESHQEITPKSFPIQFISDCRIVNPVCSALRSRYEVLCYSPSLQFELEKMHAVFCCLVI